MDLKISPITMYTYCIKDMFCRWLICKFSLDFKLLIFHYSISCYEKFNLEFKQDCVILILNHTKKNLISYIKSSVHFVWWTNLHDRTNLEPVISLWIYKKGAKEWHAKAINSAFLMYGCNLKFQTSCVFSKLILQVRKLEKRPGLK